MAAAPPASASLLSPDLRKRIEIMAEHIARNGQDFENTVRQKNVQNPQFSFLYEGGEGQEYYVHVLVSHRGSASGGGGGVDYVELLRRWKEPPVYPLALEVDRQLAEVVASLEAMASRDAIRNGRAWVERVVEMNSAVATQLAGTLMRRISGLQTCAHRLHVLYLVHDVLQTEAARKDGSQKVIRAFKPFLLWMLRPAYQIAQKVDPASGVSTNNSESMQLLRLVQLWAERGILDAQEAEEIKALVTPPQLPGVTEPPFPPVPPARPSPSSSPGVGMQQLQQPPQPPQPLQQQMGGMQHAGSPRPPGMTGMMGMPCGGGMLGGMMNGQMQLMPGQMGQMPPHSMPGMMPQSRLQGYRPLAPHMVGKQSPETVPVGVLSTMMMHAMRRIGRANFVPYRPLDPAHTPQMLPPMEMPAQRLMERVEDFYLDLKDEERSSNSSSSRSSRSSSRSRSRSRSRSAEVQRLEQAGFQAPIMLGMGSMSAVPPPAVD